MNIKVYNDGYFSLFGNDDERITRSPLGIHIYEHCAYLPQSCVFDGKKAVVTYPHGSCTITFENKTNYTKLTLSEVSSGTTGFIFGPYKTTASYFGEILGAGWYDDNSVVCIQSLMPKVEEGIIPRIENNCTDIDFTNFVKAASRADDFVYLHCSVKDRTNDEIDNNGFCVQALNGDDAVVEGASVALLYADNADLLLDYIGELEINEGLPHPTYLGNYAKKDKRVSSFYFVIDGSDMSNKERVDIARRANVNCVYFSDLIRSWGHFIVNKNKFPGGIEEVARATDEAYADGIISGAHSLSNFIHTYDEYVTPIPHNHLIVRDKTTLKSDIDSDATDIYIKDAVGYTKKSALNVLRIDDELIQFGDFDAKTNCLTGCTRGAFGTQPAPHSAKSSVLRLKDHGYRTLFPDIILQDEMAHRLGSFMKNCGIRKMSFDGLEGCYETGHGNYGCAKYVKDTLAAAGNELICESSIMTHYLWHAFSYCNWGEPHYDSSRRGGMHAYRARNQAFYKRNLIPAMLGWYTLFIASDDGKWEATPPENMEHILSRSVAFDAGEALRFNTDTIRKHGLMGEYLDMISVWNRFRHEADIPDELRTRMMDEESDWHLEETEDGWKLTQLIIRDQDLSYCDREVATEGGSVGTGSITENNRIHHSTVMVFDGSYPLDADGIYPHLPSVDAEPIRFRIKVGKPGLGYMENLNIYDTLNFKFKANGGEYLVYEGGTTLYRYDLNYNLLETIEGEGTPFVMPKGEPFLWGELKYTTDNNPNASYLFKEFRQKQIYNIKKKIK